MRTVRNLINGTPRDALSGATSELVDPATGKVFGTAPLSGDEDVDAAYPGRVTGQVLTRGLAFEQPCGAGEEPQLVDHDVQFLGPGQL